MPLYFFHLRDGVDEVRDQEGIHCDDLAHAKSKAVTAARGLIASDALEGVIDLSYRIDVEDAQCTIVHSLSFSGACTIKRARAINDQ